LTDIIGHVSFNKKEKESEDVQVLLLLL